MAATLHFGIGLAIGTIGYAPRLLMARRRGDRVADAILRWLIVSYGLAVLAIVPSLLRRVGVPEPFCGGWWMNAFVFHSWIGGLRTGGLYTGMAVIGACFAVQYSTILAGIAGARARPKPDGPPATPPPVRPAP